MKILVLAAHPDDEVLGCGGTLHKLSKSDNQIHLAFAADGVSGYKNHSQKEINQRKKAMLKVADKLSAKVVGKSRPPFRDQQLDRENFNKIVGWAEKLITQVKPDILYTHWSKDLNRDHRIVSEAVMVASRPWSAQLKEIYAFEVPENSCEGGIFAGESFNPNIYETIDLEKKKSLMACYETETARSGKWLAGVEALATYRGFNAGVSYAEAFVLIRKINAKD